MFGLNLLPAAEILDADQIQLGKAGHVLGGGGATGNAWVIGVMAGSLALNVVANTSTAMTMTSSATVKPRAGWGMRLSMRRSPMQARRAVRH